MFYGMGGSGGCDVGGQPLPGEVLASWNSDPNSPHGASPMHGTGHSGSIGGPSGPMPMAPGNSGHFGMPVNSNSLRSPTALHGTRDGGAMDTRLTAPRGASGAFSNLDAYIHRVAHGAAPTSPGPHMHNTAGSRGGPVRSPNLIYRICEALLGT